MIALIKDRVKSHDVDLNVFTDLSVRSLLLIEADYYKEGSNVPHAVQTCHLN